MYDVPQGSVSKIPGGLEPKLAIFGNQAKPQVERLDTKPSIYSLSCLHSVLEPEPSRILTKETRETASSD